jgi:hypothetical protein
MDGLEAAMDRGLTNAAPRAIFAKRSDTNETEFFHSSLGSHPESNRESDIQNKIRKRNIV